MTQKGALGRLLLNMSGPEQLVMQMCRSLKSRASSAFLGQVELGWASTMGKRAASGTPPSAKAPKLSLKPWGQKMVMGAQFHGSIQRCLILNTKMTTNYTALRQQVCRLQWVHCHVSAGAEAV